MSKTSQEIEKAMADALASVERLERKRDSANDVVAEQSTAVIQAEGAPPASEPVASPAPATEAAPASQPEPEPEPPATDWQATAATLKDQLLRMAADFDNFRKRARRERDEQKQLVIEEVLKIMLPVADNLERAVAAAPPESADPVLQGVRMVLRQFTDLLASFGVKAVSAVGQPFDPERHEAMTQEVVPEAAVGTVLRELERGYVIGDRLLRAAKVVVAGAPPETQGEA